MSILGSAGICALLALWIVYREHRNDNKPLPPPVADERDKLAEWRKFWQDASRG